MHRIIWKPICVANLYDALIYPYHIIYVHIYIYMYGNTANGWKECKGTKIETWRMCKRYNIVAPIERAEGSYFFKFTKSVLKRFGISLAINALAQLQKRRMDERIVPWLTSGVFEGLVWCRYEWLWLIICVCLLTCLCKDLLAKLAGSFQTGNGGSKIYKKNRVKVGLASGDMNLQCGVITDPLKCYTTGLIMLWES